MIKYILGIDLGTSNTAAAWRRVDGPDSSILAMEQVYSPGNLGRKAILPSVLYHPAAGEAPWEALRLPWQDEKPEAWIAGQWAKERAAEAPDRTVMSAKSWLCNYKVDRDEAFLPWKSETTHLRLSPVAASAAILRHVSECFATSRGQSGEAIDWDEVQVILTVPASFDEAARILTKKAADQTNIKHLILLEEPQAAFYSWIGNAEKTWRSQVKAGDVVLVIDIGGGTTDFSMIAVNERDGELALERISVGDHLLLGGDNMDLALASVLADTLESQGKTLDHWQFQSLIAGCRQGKEEMFKRPELDEYPVSIASRSASLFTSTMTAKLRRHHLDEILIDGFFPMVEPDVFPTRERSPGLREFGLDYETDAAITKHLALFLRRSKDNVASNPQLRTIIAPELTQQLSGQLKPTKVLFNGGVFGATAMQQRIVDILSRWSGNEKISVLAGNDPDLAVAMGACYFGANKVSGSGFRIRAGTARSYYLGLESVGLAIPGSRPKVRGLCIVPQGTEEGSKLQLTTQQFGLTTGDDVVFRFFSSSARAGDTLGQLVPDAERELNESSRLAAHLEPLEDGRKEVVPVTLSAEISEIGTLEINLNHRHSPKKWNLEFNVRTQE